MPIVERRERGISMPFRPEAHFSQ